MPLWKSTVREIRTWLRYNPALSEDAPLLPNRKVRLAAAQFIIERGYGKAPERIGLLDAREQGPLPGAELTEQEAYMRLIKFKTYEEMKPYVVDAEKTDSGDYPVIELDG